ncbi:MAG: acyl-CoA dehydratase activase-related protein, partial [Bacilli bacterium]
PRSLFFYYDGDLWKNFFENLNCKVIISPHTTKEIIKTGSAVAQDEMCLSFKNYLGHIAYLQNKCDYIVVPRIDNYGIGEQTCTNFLASYDIVHNLFATKIINYNINLVGKETEFKAFKKMGEKFEKDKKKVKWAYYRAKEKSLFQFEQDVNNNIAKLKSKKKKILIVGHPYNVHDTYIGKPIMNILEKLNVEIIYSDLFSKAEARKESFFLCHDLYWKYSKEIIGPIKMIEKQIDGVLFLSSFPCGLDSLVNELVIRKLNLPYLSLVIDDIDSLIGFETRIESFIDIVERVKEYA